VTALPDSVAEPLRSHLGRVRSLHNADLKRAAIRPFVHLSKYPG